MSHHCHQSGNSGHSDRSGHGHSDRSGHSGGCHKFGGGKTEHTEKREICSSVSVVFTVFVMVQIIF